jgi:hypothetical protein
MAVLKTHGKLASQLASRVGADSGTIRDYDVEEWISPGDYRQRATGGKGISRHRFDRFVDRVKDMAAGLGVESYPDTNGHPAYPISLVERAWKDVMLGFRDKVSAAARDLNQQHGTFPDRQTAWDALVSYKNTLWDALQNRSADEVRAAAVIVAAAIQKLVEDSKTWRDNETA